MKFKKIMVSLAMSTVLFTSYCYTAHATTIIPMVNYFQPIQSVNCYQQIQPVYYFQPINYFKQIQPQQIQVQQAQVQQAQVQQAQVQRTQVQQAQVQQAQVQQAQAQQSQVQQAQAQQAQVQQAQAQQTQVQQAQVQQAQAQQVFTIVEYGTTWCPHSQNQKQILTQIQNKYGNRVVFRFVDIEAKGNENISKQYNIKGIPHVIILNSQNQQIDQFVGLKDQNAVEQILRRNGLIN